MGYALWFFPGLQTSHASMVSNFKGEEEIFLLVFPCITYGEDPQETPDSKDGPEISFSVFAGTFFFFTGTFCFRTAGVEIFETDHVVIFPEEKEDFFGGTEASFFFTGFFMYSAYFDAATSASPRAKTTYA